MISTCGAGTRGIIPAYAGSTLRISRTPCLGRIIPAYAGSTPWRCPGVDFAWDHPRIRGEHWIGRCRVRAIRGSSPHTRGALRLLGRSPGRHPDHPRIRGEHRYYAGQIGGVAGSSPHTRGARNGRNRRAPGQRIIPAYAGSTRAWLGPVGSQTDHPRIRGEHPTFAPPIDTNAGSSPHTRGARWGPHPFSYRPGIIPAYAGSTWNPDASGKERQDHPRIRGEHVQSVALLAF